MLQSVKKQVTTALGCLYQTSNHTDVDTSEIVWRVANKIREIGLDTFLSGRDNNETAKKAVAILSAGGRLLKSSTIATFNKKVRRLNEGYIDPPDELDQDSVPALGIVFEAPENGGDSG